jgi:hypothetical protein
MADIYLMKINVTYESRLVEPGVTPFGRMAAGPKGWPLMFDHKMLIHTTDTIARIVSEIKLAKMPISLQRIFTVPIEKIR